MFDDEKVFENIVNDRIEYTSPATIIQCCVDDRYKKILHKICEGISLATYMETQTEMLREYFN